MILIEPFNQKDSEEIALVMREAFNYVNQGWSKEESETYIQEYFDHSCNWIARDENKIVGFIIANKQVTSLFVDAIGVLPSEMGKGIAKMLWEKTEQYAKEQNLEDIKMIADPESSAYQWYMKLGFEETGWVEIIRKINN